MVTTEKYTLNAGVPVIISAHSTPITIHIPAGTTAKVSMTCATADEIAADTADWVDWPNGDQAGPFIDALLNRVAALKLESTAGGVVYLAREQF
jgi:hypothetical protein